MNTPDLSAYLSLTLDAPDPAVPARPVLSEACRQRIAELLADWPPLTDATKARIRGHFVAHFAARRAAMERGSDAA